MHEIENQVRGERGHGLFADLAVTGWLGRGDTFATGNINEIGKEAASGSNIKVTKRAGRTVHHQQYAAAWKAAGFEPHRIEPGVNLSGQFSGLRLVTGGLADQVHRFKDIFERARGNDQSSETQLL